RVIIVAREPQYIFSVFLIGLGALDRVRKHKYAKANESNRDACPNCSQSALRRGDTSPANVHAHGEKHGEKHDFQRQHVNHDPTNVVPINEKSPRTALILSAKAMAGNEWPKTLDTVFIAMRREHHGHKHREANR